ncbi:hypothetical protein [Actinobacillus pleuropneumoniae]|uniref:Uncharacterized protein n=1 Tax=Actinobacillus pleuropneumoniae TaxID=715 RepID=A0ABM6X3Y7_ACTPL|nr:hypothetical protein [Actinobacillus pleuropneumoniae]AWG95534.1 hypothetical protein APPSER1_06015 [Actinobacillus pleuropneumoniae serovar 1 str. 4074]AXA21605.1 hypothetical protein DRF63_06010 [Actinobacillus pleuropneumoniae]WBY04223.1 hypothetical protein PE794_06025 [Actinobacillus pleuropneumoniae]
MRLFLLSLLILFNSKVMSEPLTKEFIDKVIYSYSLCKNQADKDKCAEDTYANIEHIWLYKRWLNLSDQHYSYEATKFSNGYTDESKSIVLYIDSFDSYKMISFSEVGSNVFSMRKGDKLKVIFDKENLYHFKIHKLTDKYISIKEEANIFIELLKKSSQIEVEIPTIHKKLKVLFNVQDFKGENF